MPSTQQPSQEMLTSTPTRCIPIKASNKNNHLPSSAIRRSELVNVTTIVQKYQNYCHPSRIAILARKLAEKCYFGPTALKQCTVSGYRGEPALPIKELNDLKHKSLLCCHNFGVILLSLRVSGQPALSPLGSFVKQFA